MSRSDVTVRVQSLDGTWEVLGADKGRGIVPENVQYSHDTWGSASASFVLKRDPAVPWPDLSAFTPVDIWVGGVKTWSGRVAQTPISDSPESRQIAVSCAGWQYHLDDDVYEGKYVHTRLSDWAPIRSNVNVALSGYSSALDVTAGSGAIVLAVPNGNTLPAGGKSGVFLDLGPSNAAKRVVVTYLGGSGGTLDLKLHGSTDMSSTTESFTLDATPLATSSTTVAQSFSDSFRYIRIEAGNAGSVTGGDQVWVQITAIQVFMATAYESSNASILKSSQVVTDALTRAAPLLSTDTSRISTGSFSIPDYAPDGYRTPREHIAAVNAYDNYQAYVDVDQRVVYAARDTSPVVEVGAWSGASFEDASTNSTQDIYNRVIVEGNGPDGTTLRIDRLAAQQAGVALDAITTPVADNPSFTTNTTSWSGMTRDTGTFDTTPASGVLSTGFATESFTGTFRAGVTYVLRLAIKSSSAIIHDLWFGASPSDRGQLSLIPTASFVTVSVSWTPAASSATATLSIAGIAGGTWIDSLALYTAKPTIVDRRGFRRTMILSASSAMTAEGGNTIGDRYLSNHRATPLKGSLRVTGPTGVRRVQGGAGVHPSQLGLLTNQLIRLSHRVDFDNGNVGKDGTIVSVNYDHNAESATIELDNSSGNFEALMARLAVNVGQVS